MEFELKLTEQDKFEIRQELARYQAFRIIRHFRDAIPATKYENKVARRQLARVMQYLKSAAYEDTDPHSQY